jgi:hypothetical protein
MRYNHNGSTVFVAYRNASLANSGDDSTWRNARASEKACSACIKRGDTCLRKIVSVYGDVDLGACVWCQERSVRCSIAQRGKARRQSSGEKRKRSEKGKEKETEVGSEVEESSGEEPLAKKAKVAGEVEGEVGGSPIAEAGPSGVARTPEVEGAGVQGEVPEEAEEVRGEEGGAQGEARRSKSGAALVADAIRELTEVCRRGFDDMREGLAELREDSWLFRRVAEEYLNERRRANLSRLGDWAVEEGEESEEEEEFVDYVWDH